MESQFINIGENNNNNLDAFDEDGLLIEIEPTPPRLNKCRGKLLPDVSSMSKNRDRTAIMADVLMAIIYNSEANMFKVTKNRIPQEWGQYALISQIHYSVRLTPGKTRNILAELRDAGLITVREVERKKYNRNSKKDKVNGNIAILIYITAKGKQYIEKLKDIHENYYPILKDCYMIKSSLVNYNL